MNIMNLAVAILLAVVSAHGAAEIEVRHIDPPTLNKHPAYTQVTTVKGDMRLIFIAGQVDRAVDYRPGNNECRHPDMRGQYIGAMDNIEKALAAAGATWANVVSIRRYTVDMQGYLDVVMDRDNPLPAYWHVGAAPPSTLVEVVRLSEPCQLLEHEVMAIVASD